MMLFAACAFVLAFRPLADADDECAVASTPDATRTPKITPNRERLLITSFPPQEVVGTEVRTICDFADFL